LRLVPVVGGQPDVDVLAGAMAWPSGHREVQAAHARGLIDDLDDLGGAPDQSPL
jgi:hypothetical protein